MSIDLPAAVVMFFEISNGADDARVLNCFTADAVVVDEGNTHVGHGAIQQWQRAAQQAFDYTVEPISAATDGKRITVKANVVGNFPGSPVQLEHVFDLAGDEIKSLRIA